MSWTNLFKSRGGKAKADPRIRWFGKLPTYPDYYSSPADEEWAVEFNDWVLKGLLSSDDKGRIRTCAGVSNIGRTNPRGQDPK